MQHRGKAMARKTVARKNGKKIGKISARQHAKGSASVREKWRAAVKKANEIRKSLKAKMTAMQAEHQEKLKQVEAHAYEKACMEFHAAQEKKAKAKEKLLQAAAEKFERKYASKMNRKTKGRRRPLAAKRLEITSAQKPALAKKAAKAHGARSKKRGRPSKHLAA